MPTYEYRCPDDHVVERKAGYDDTEIDCPTCGREAKRQAVYRSQGVIFVGEGFTKTVLPPAPPLPPGSQGLTSDEHAETLDDFAKKRHQYDRNDRPYVREIERREE